MDVLLPRGTSISVLMITVQGMMLSVFGQDHVQALTLFPVVFLVMFCPSVVYGARMVRYKLLDGCLCYIFVRKKKDSKRDSKHP